MKKETYNPAVVGNPNHQYEPTHIWHNDPFMDGKRASNDSTTISARNQALNNKMDKIETILKKIAILLQRIL